MNYVKDTLQLNAVTWTDYQPAVRGNYMWLRNKSGVQIIIRTDKNNAATEDTIEDGLTEDITADFVAYPGNQFRFNSGVTAFSAKAASGTPNLNITLLR